MALVGSNNSLSGGWKGYFLLCQRNTKLASSQLHGLCTGQGAGPISTDPDRPPWGKISPTSLSTSGDDEEDALHSSGLSRFAHKREAAGRRPSRRRS